MNFRNSKATLRTFLGWFAAVWFIGLFIAAFLAYFVTSAGPNPTDGLGRPLTEAPVLMRIVFGQDRMWAGLSWFLGEMVIFWGCVVLAMKITDWLKD